MQGGYQIKKIQHYLIISYGNKSMYKISIVTICRNVARDLERTIISVESQTFCDYEYIVVDGNSTDNTLDVIKQHQSVITKWVSEPDKGIYDAMNKGIKMASGEWLIMMNAGDYFAGTDVLEKVFARDIPKDKTFMYSDVYGLRPNGERILRPLSWEKGNMIHQTVIYRKSLHEMLGYYHVTKPLIISDYLFFISVPREQVMKLEDVVIAVYEGGGVSAQGNWARQQAICADVVFRRRTFWGMIRYYIWKQIKGIIPTETKDKIKLALGIKGNL